MGTRTVNTGFDPEGELRSVLFTPDAGVEIKDQLVFTDNPTTVDLPVKTNEFVRYELEIDGKIVGRFYLADGEGAADLPTLLTVGGAIPDALIEHLEQRMAFAIARSG